MTREQLLTLKAVHRSAANLRERAFALEQENERLRQELEVLRRSEESAQLMLRAVSGYLYAVYLEDGEVARTEHGPRCVNVTGYTPEEYEANPFLWIEMVLEDDREAVKKLAYETMAGKNPPALEHRIVHKSGEQKWVRNTMALQPGPDGKPIACYGAVDDITARKRAELELARQKESLAKIVAERTKDLEKVNRGLRREIGEREKAERALQEQAEKFENLSLHDDLTGLLNRRGFMTFAGRELKIARRTRRRPVLFFFDLDKLKEINDQLGHLGGDEALLEAVRAIRGMFQDSDIVARLGGDEFAALATDDPERPGADLIRSVERQIKAYNASNSGEAKSGISFGAAPCDPEDGFDLEALLDRADRCMYMQKTGKKAEEANLQKAAGA